MNGTHIFFYFILDLLDDFEGGFYMDWVEVFSLVLGFTMVDHGSHGWWNLSIVKIYCSESNLSGLTIQWEQKLDQFFGPVCLISVPRESICVISGIHLRRRLWFVIQDWEFRTQFNNYTHSFIFFLNNKKLFDNWHFLIQSRGLSKNKVNLKVKVKFSQVTQHGSKLKEGSHQSKI